MLCCRDATRQPVRLSNMCLQRSGAQAAATPSEQGACDCGLSFTSALTSAWIFRSGPPSKASWRVADRRKCASSKPGRGAKLLV